MENQATQAEGQASVDAAEIAAGTFNRKDPASNDLMKRALDILSGRDVDNDNESDPENAGTEKTGADSKGKPKGAPKTLAEAAERLGIKPEEIYALEVSIADGQDAEKFTVGALKDAMKERTDFKLDQLRWGETKAEQEGEILRSRSELVELLGMLPKESIKPEVINKIREKHNATLKLERERTLLVIPEWKDEKRSAADIDAMKEHLSRAGFPSNYMDNVSDHRTMRYIRENMLREQRILQALALVKPKQKEASKTKEPSGGSRKGPTKPTNVSRGTTGEGQKIDAVKNLLKGLG